MSEVKLPYYPQIAATLSVSPFGVQELNCPEIYDKPLKNKVIFRVDLMECLRPIFGDECLHYRDFLYRIVAGHTNNFGASVHDLYRKFPSFRKFVNEEFYFGNDSIPINDRLLRLVADKLKNYGEYVSANCANHGGKVLIYTHYKVYYAYATRDQVPDIVGGTVIC